MSDNRPTQLPAEPGRLVDPKPDQDLPRPAPRPDQDLPEPERDPVRPGRPGDRPEPKPEPKR